MSRILVTGCNGYIGRHLVPALEQRGHSIVGLDRQAADTAPSEFHLADLNDGGLGRVLEQVDLVVHLAAAKDDWGISDEGYRRDNVDATRALLAAGSEAGVSRWVFYSTVSVYGPSEQPVDETARHRPDNPYGRSKAEAEALFGDYVAQNPNAEVMIIRPSVVFGPGHPDITNVSRLIEAIDRGRFLRVGGGEAVKSTSYIENLVAATVFLMGRTTPGISGYIVTDEPRLTTNQLVSEISARLGKRPPRWSMPLPLALPIAALGDVAAKLSGRNIPITSARIKKFNTGTNFDAARLRALGFDQPVTIADALDRTVSWHRAKA